MTFFSRIKNLLLTLVGRWGKFGRASPPKFFFGKFGRASMLLAGFGLAAKLVGLLRDRILAGNFTSGELDIYYSAFKIPDLIFNIFVLGAVSSAFIPVFIEHYQLDKEKAWKLTQNFINIAFVLVLTASALMFIFANWLVVIIAPGFEGEARRILLSVLRIMLMSPVIFSLSTIIGSVLQALERFWAYALAPVLYNLGIIFGAVYLTPVAQDFGVSRVYALAGGVILGTILHLLIQLLIVFRSGFRFARVFDFNHDGFRRIFRLLLPRTFGLGAYSIDSAVTNALASTMTAGSITMFNFANNLQFVPISVLGVSVATAIFPRLSAHASAGERVEFIARLNHALKTALAIVVPMAIVGFIFRNFIIRAIFHVGNFSASNVETTASVLGIFMFGVIGHSLVPIMSRAFYAFQNTRTPVILSLISIISNIVLGLIFTFVLGLGVRGLATSFSIAGNLNFILLYLAFRRRYAG